MYYGVNVTRLLPKRDHAGVSLSSQPIAGLPCFALAISVIFLSCFIAPMPQHASAVAKAYAVLHPMLLQESGSLHGKSTVVVANAPSHPHGLGSTLDEVQSGRKHVLQTVPVAVTSGQLTLLHGWVKIEVVVWMTVAVMLLNTVTG